MGISVNQELMVFLWSIVCGVLAAVVFDLFRIMRRLINSNYIRTSFEDIFYWVLSSLLIYYFALRFNGGEIRWYMLFGVASGALFYLLTLSNLIINTVVAVIRFFVKITKQILKILFMPVRFVVRIAGRPFILIFNISFKNIKRFSEKLIINIKNLKKFVTKI